MQRSGLNGVSPPTAEGRAVCAVTAHVLSSFSLIFMAACRSLSLFLCIYFTELLLRVVCALCCVPELTFGVHTPFLVVLVFFVSFKLNSV